MPQTRIASSSQLRLAECDFFLKRFAQRPRRAYGRSSSAGRGKPKRCTSTRWRRATWATPPRIYQAVPRASSTSFRRRAGPKSRSTLSAPTTLGQDDDDRADAAFRELYAKYPKGRYAERAAWKAGWRAIGRGGTRRRRLLRARVARLPALGLPAVVAVLGRPRARAAEGEGVADSAICSSRRGLSELVLRPPRGEAARIATRRRAPSRSPANGRTCRYRRCLPSAAAKRLHRPRAARGRRCTTMR